MIFVFPGQGSQIVGMGQDMYNNFPVAREVFNEVDDTLGRKLSKIIFNGSIEELTITENAQPALMTVSIATLRVMEHLFGRSFFRNIDYVCGHSVGEYTALCASGALSLASTAKLLQIRSTAMHNASSEFQGGMLALLGTEIDEVEKILDFVRPYGICEIANDNGGGQVVVSGSALAISKLMDTVKDSNIKRAVKLQVSGPFHCKLMHSAYETMVGFVKDIEINKPSIPIIFNVTAREENDPQTIKSLIAKQIVSTVRWREIVLYTIQKGIKRCIEIGPGQVLSNLIKRIDQSINVKSINNLSNINDFIADLSLVD